MRCFQQQNPDGTTETPQEYLRSEYDEATGKFPEALVHSALHQTRKAHSKARRQLRPVERRTIPSLTRAELVKITEDHLLKAMNADATEVATAANMAKYIVD